MMHTQNIMPPSEHMAVDEGEVSFQTLNTQGTVMLQDKNVQIV
jgi:hypothetical protein